MNTLDDAFTRLLGTQPTDQQKQDLYRTRDALKLKNDDVLWLLLMALGHYETLYRRFPALISEAAVTTLAKVKETASAELKASASATQRELTAALARAAERAAPGTTRCRTLRWTLASLVTSAVCLSFVGWVAYRHGAVSGFSQGWVNAHRTCADENAAAAWGNTPEGQLAYALAKAGSLRDLANCSGRGWVQKGRVCFPRSDGGSVYGWRLPLVSGHDVQDP